MGEGNKRRLDRARPFGRAIVVPKLVADAGKRFANFFGSIENDSTRPAYQRACTLFFACGAIATTWRWRTSSEPCRRLCQSPGREIREADRSNSTWPRASIQAALEGGLSRRPTGRKVRHHR
jgi:hypothetical protein